MQNQIKISYFDKENSSRGNLVKAIIFTSTFLLFISCTVADWKNSGDSCILLSEKPPLRRVINYTDHDLCGRKLSPRIAPNPQTRAQTEID